MSNHAIRIEPERGQIDCFQCESGCVHFEYGYTLLSFSKDTFMHIADLFNETKTEILREEEKNDWSHEILTEYDI